MIARILAHLRTATQAQGSIRCLVNNAAHKHRSPHVSHHLTTMCQYHTTAYHVAHALTHYKITPTPPPARPRRCCNKPYFSAHRTASSFPLALKLSKNSSEPGASALLSISLNGMLHPSSMSGLMSMPRGWPGKHMTVRGSEVGGLGRKFVSPPSTAGRPRKNLMGTSAP